MTSCDGGSKEVVVRDYKKKNFAGNKRGKWLKSRFNILFCFSVYPDPSSVPLLDFTLQEGGLQRSVQLHGDQGHNNQSINQSAENGQIFRKFFCNLLVFKP